MANRRTGSNRISAPILIPPQGFLILEPNLYRAWDPILNEHLPFLKKLKLRFIFFFFYKFFLFDYFLVLF